MKPARTSRPVGDSIFTEVYHAIDAKGGAATAAQIITAVVRSGIKNPHTGEPYERGEFRKCIERMVRKGMLLEDRETYLPQVEVDTVMRELEKVDSLKRRRDNLGQESHIRELGKLAARNKGI